MLSMVYLISPAMLSEIRMQGKITLDNSNCFLTQYYLWKE